MVLKSGARRPVNHISSTLPLKETTDSLIEHMERVKAAQTEAEKLP